MDDRAWDQLIARIANGRCTPFIGAGACTPVLPQGSQLAEKWAEECRYPLSDRDNLVRVAQYIAVDLDPMAPKERIERELSGFGPPDFSEPGEPHGLLARLPLPLYVTTNYDHFMTQALRAEGRDAVQEICKWNDSLTVQDEPAYLLDDPARDPTRANPVVFHLHGRFGLPESIVLTEDDYLDFLTTLLREGEDVLPSQVLRAVGGTSLLFIGYSLADWDFRVLHRGLVMRSDHSLRRFSVAVQLNREADAEAYLDKYFRRMDISVYWGDAASFCGELWERWDSRERVAQ